MQAQEPLKKRRNAGTFKGKGDPRNGHSPGRPVRSIAIPDALRTEGMLPDEKNPSITKFQAFIREVYKAATAGDLDAIKFIADRTEGKVKDTIAIEGQDGPSDIVILWPRIEGGTDDGQKNLPS